MDLPLILEEKNQLQLDKLLDAKPETLQLLGPENTSSYRH